MITSVLFFIRYSTLSYYNQKSTHVFSVCAFVVDTIDGYVGGAHISISFKILAVP